MRISENKNFLFNSNLLNKIGSYTKTRLGEERVGDCISGNWQESTVKYVILGISESIGPQANFGRSGAEKAFDAFLKVFVNMQVTSNMLTETFAFAGEITCERSFTHAEEARNWVVELDHFVVEIVKPIIELGKTPIIIGGGHNNAFPIIQAFYQLNKSLAIINMDAHADCRALDGRHSGNPFSYAIDQKQLASYGVFGLHAAFNNRQIINFLIENKVQFGYFDDYVFYPEQFMIDVKTYLSTVFQENFVGVELDMDCLANVPSSAMSPIGFTINDARKYIVECLLSAKIGYFHFPEGAVIQDGDDRIIGRILAQFVFDILTFQKK
jgi:formiminoglutamase